MACRKLILNRRKLILNRPASIMNVLQSMLTYQIFILKRSTFILNRRNGKMNHCRSKKTWAHGPDDEQLSLMTANRLLMGFHSMAWDLGCVKNHFVSLIATLAKDINWFTNSIITLLLLQLQSMNDRSLLSAGQLFLAA